MKKLSESNPTTRHIFKSLFFCDYSRWRFVSLLFLNKERTVKLLHELESKSRVTQHY